MAERARSSRDIRDEINETRRRMDERLHAIDERLTVGQLVDRVVGLVRGEGGSTMRTGSRRVVDAVRGNPVPLALVGAGLAWLLIEESRDRPARLPEGREPEPLPSESERRASWPRPVPEGGLFPPDEEEEAGMAGYEGERWGEPAEEGRVEGGPGWRERARRRLGAGFGAAREAGRKAGHRASELRESAGEAAEQARGRGRGWRRRARAVGEGFREELGERGEHAAGTLRRRSHELREGVGQRSGRAADELRHQWDSNPLGLGAVAFSVGLTSGLLAPRTRAERRFMGPTAERTRQRAVEAGKEALHKGERLVAAAAGEAEQEARRQGILPEELAEKGRQVGREVRRAGHEELQRQQGRPTERKEQAGAVVRESFEAGKREAERQDLTPEKAAERLGEVAHEAREGARRKAEEEGLERGRVERKAEQAAGKGQQTEETKAEKGPAGGRGKKE